jgi:hypothetical protein
MIGIGVCALFVNACATDAADDPSGDEVLDEAPSVPQDATPVDVPDAPAGSILTAKDVASASDGSASDGSATGDAASTGRACPTGKVCMYQKSGRRGEQVIFVPPVQVRNLHNVPCQSCTDGTNGNDGTFNDQMSSWQNASSIRYCWYTNAPFHGEHVMNPHTTRLVLPRDLNDTASSIRPCP